MGAHGDDEEKRVKRLRGTGRTAGVLAAAVCAALALPGGARAAGEGGGYAFDDKARRGKGAISTLEAARLTAGQRYWDTIRKGGKLF